MHKNNLACIAKDILVSFFAWWSRSFKTYFDMNLENYPSFKTRHWVVVHPKKGICTSYTNFWTSSKSSSFGFIYQDLLFENLWHEVDIGDGCNVRSLITASFWSFFKQNVFHHWHFWYDKFCWKERRFGVLDPNIGSLDKFVYFEYKLQIQSSVEENTKAEWIWHNHGFWLLQLLH